MNPLMLNEDAIRAVVAWIELNPSLWEQRVCRRKNNGKRALDFASWTCKLAGFDLLEVGFDDNTEWIFLLAQRLLGLNDMQAFRLLRFGWSDNEPVTLDQLKSQIHDVTGIEFDCFMKPFWIPDDG